MVGLLEFLHYFSDLGLQTTHPDIFTPECVYLCPNEYTCVQMCIFMTNLIKFSGLSVTEAYH